MFSAFAKKHVLLSEVARTTQSILFNIEGVLLMDWPGFWKFLSDISVYVYLVLLFGGGALLSFLRKLYEARQTRLIAVAQARVEEKELQLKIAEVKAKQRELSSQPKRDNLSLQYEEDHPYQSQFYEEPRSQGYEGYRENPPLQQW